ncbi:MAG TPA: hypothetical protein DD435_13220 [Cyanobacteria bacterium UBA8530]|nr:hypothetical protein [Cyanobacteria bacterium UBA8530]
MSMRAVIIAGGSGTRLRPLTYNTPKPMVPLFNKPFVQYQIEMLRRHGITEIIINLHYLADAIRAHFGDGSALGVKLFYSFEKQALGTAGAVKNAEEFFNEEPLIVLNGDILTDIDLGELIRQHHQRQAKATLALIRVTDPTSYGLVFTTTEGKIYRFLEKPSWDEATVDTVNAGIYVLDPSVLRYVPRNEAYSFERGLFPLLLQLKEPFYASITENYWLDIGSPSKYMQAHSDILKRLVKVDLDAQEVSPGIFFGKGVDVDPSAELRGPLFLGDGVRVDRGAKLNEFTIIGARTSVGPGCSIQHSLVWEDNQIGAEVNLSHAILGHACRIGNQTRIDTPTVLADRSVLETGTLLG